MLSARVRRPLWIQKLFLVQLSVPVYGYRSHSFDFFLWPPSGSLEGSVFRDPRRKFGVSQRSQHCTYGFFDTWITPMSVVHSFIAWSSKLVRHCSATCQHRFVTSVRPVRHLQRSMQEQRRGAAEKGRRGEEKIWRLEGKMRKREQRMKRMMNRMRRREGEEMCVSLDPRKRRISHVALYTNLE